MTFLNVNLLFIVTSIVLICAVLFFIWIGVKRRRRVLQKILCAEMLKRLQSGASTRKRFLRNILFLLGVICVLLAVARPWWGQKLTPVPEKSRSVLLVLDCSKSMLAADTEPSRIKHGKWYVRQIIKKFQGDKFGIISFARDAFLECPLTTDVNTLFTFLRDIDTSTIPVGGTNINKALKVAEEAFEDAGSSHRAVILISDGGELQGDALQGTDSFRQKNIPIIAVGVGKADEGTLIKTADGGYLRDKEGEPVMTRLNNSILKKLAMRTNGEYIHSTTGNSNLKQCVKRLEKVIPQKNEEEKRMRPVERFQIPLGVALVLFLAGLCIGERRRDSKVKMILLLFMLIPFVSMPGKLLAQSQNVNADTDADSASVQKQQLNPSLRQPVSPSRVSKKNSSSSESGLAEEKKKKLQERVEQIQRRLENSVEENPERLHYNLGNVFQQLGRNDKAREQYKAAMKSIDENNMVHAWSLWNLGVMNHFEGMKLVENDMDKAVRAFRKSVGYYREALRQLPLLENWPKKKLEELTEDLARNYEVASTLLESVENWQEKMEKLRELWQKARKSVSQAQQKQKKLLSEKMESVDPANMDKAQSRIEIAKERIGELKRFLQQIADEYESEKLQQQLQRVGKAYPHIEKALTESKQASQEAVEPNERNEVNKSVKERLDLVARLLGMNDQNNKNNKYSDNKQQKNQQSDKEQQNANDGEKHQKKGDDKSGEKDDEKSEMKSDESIAENDIQGLNKKTQEQKTGQAKKQENEINRQQAIGILQKMADQERDFRDALKRYRKKFKSEEVEKDW